MNKKKVIILLMAGWFLLSSLLVAQRFQDRRRRAPRWYRSYTPTLEAMWPANEKFKHDVFTFVRVRYTSWADVYGQPQWSVDYPDSDMNLSYRLQELTSLHVNPQPIILDLTDPEILNYPFVYLIEPGYIRLNRCRSQRFKELQ